MIFIKFKSQLYWVMFFVFITSCQPKNNSAPTEVPTTLAKLKHWQTASPAPSSTPLALPSSTVTHSPTPRQHLIQSGETLLGIALRYDSTVAALLALNPNVQPRFLTIGTLLEIPPPIDTPVALTQTTESVPANLEVQHWDCQPNGPAWVCGGWLKNYSTTPYAAIELAAFLPNTAIPQTTVGTALPILAAQAQVPFYVRSTSPMLTIQLQQAYPAESVIQQFPMLAATALSQTETTVTVQVRNPTAQTFDTVWLVVAQVWPDGRLAQYRTVTLALTAQSDSTIRLDLPKIPETTLWLAAQGSVAVSNVITPGTTGP